MKSLFVRLFLAAATVLAASAVPAQPPPNPYPSRPVRIIVPFAAGGPSDIFARPIGPEVARWKQIIREANIKAAP